MITGFTDSKLEDIRTFDPNKPYKVGINGVTYVDDDKVEYSIDDVSYVTLFDVNETTTFSSPLSDPPTIFNDRVAVFDDSNPFGDKKETESYINIDRNNYSVFEKLFKLSKITKLSDFEDLPNNYL